MFTANSMNCLTEALGLSLPGNGTVVATHADREQLFKRAGRLAVDLCQALLRARRRQRAAALHRRLQGVRERHDPGHRHGRLHQHHPAPAGHRPGGRDRLHHGATSTACRARCRSCARWPPTPTSTTWRTCTAPAASWPSWVSWPVPASCTPMCPPCTAKTMKDALDQWDIARDPARRGQDLLHGGPGRRPDPGRVQPEHPLAQPGRWTAPRAASARCDHAFSQGGRPGRAVRQHRPGRLRGQDRRRGRQPSWCSRARPTSSSPGRGGDEHPGRQGRGR